MTIDYEIKKPLSPQGIDEAGIDDNIADLIDDADLPGIARAVIEAVGQDKQDCAERHRKMTEYEKMFDYVHSGDKNGCDANWLLLAEGVIDFMADHHAFFPIDAPVKCAFKSDIPSVDKLVGLGVPQEQAAAIILQQQMQAQAAQEAADGLAELMNYQLAEEMPQWQDETLVGGLLLPLHGGYIRKCDRDHREGRADHNLIRYTNFYVNAGAKNTRHAERMTEKHEMTRAQLKRYIADGYFSNIDLKDEKDDAQNVTVYETVMSMNLDGDAYDEPYCAWVYEEEEKILRIQKQYSQRLYMNKGGQEVAYGFDKITRYVDYKFMPDYKGGFFGRGFGDLIAETGHLMNVMLNTSVDTSIMSSLGGGFFSTQFAGKSGNIAIKPGEFKAVATPGSTVRDSFLPLPLRDVSPALIQLMQFVDERGRSIININDLDPSNFAPNMPATTGVILAEKAQKKYNAIFKEIDRAFNREIKALHAHNKARPESLARYAAQGYEVGADVLNSKRYAPKSDVDFEAINKTSKMIRAQFLREFGNAPTANQTEISKELLKSFGFKDPEKYVIPPQPPAPSPLDEANMALMGAQVKLIEAQAEKTIVDAQTQPFLKKAEIENKVNDIALKGEAQQIKTAEVAAKVGNLSTDNVLKITSAIKNIADAEAAEAGSQLTQYQATVGGLGGGD